MEPITCLKHGPVRAIFIIHLKWNLSEPKTSKTQFGLNRLFNNINNVKSL